MEHGAEPIRRARKRLRQSSVANDGDDDRCEQPSWTDVEASGVRFVQLRQRKRQSMVSVFFISMALFLFTSLDATMFSRVTTVNVRDVSISTRPLPSCSCWNDTNECCNRTTLRAHKMGVVLIRDLIQLPYDIQSAIIHPSVLLHAKEASKDYRHVVVVRPIYDSIISGYFYHKTGRECWLDQNGRLRAKNKTFDWESKLAYPLLRPRQNRSLCEYLQDESTELGLHAVVDLAMSSWYAGIMPHYELVRQMEERDEAARTIYICFEQLANPTTQQATMDYILDWLYPGGEHKHSTAKRRRQEVSSSCRYHGGHSTFVNETERTYLKHVVRQYDEQLFNGLGANVTKLFGCYKRTRTE